MGNEESSEFRFLKEKQYYYRQERLKRRKASKVREILSRG